MILGRFNVVRYARVEVVQRDMLEREILETRVIPARARHLSDRTWRPPLNTRRWRSIGENLPAGSCPPMSRPDCRAA